MTTNVTRTFVSFPINDFTNCKQQLLNWASRFDSCCFFDTNDYPSSHSSYECLVAAGAKKMITADAGNAFVALRAFYDENADWLFGHLAYDLKNELEEVSSGHPDHIGFNDLSFFVPEYIIRLSPSGIEINSATGLAPEQVWKDIQSTGTLPATVNSLSPAGIRSRFTREEYIAVVVALKNHILRGDCYEINFCQEFYAERMELDPARAYAALCAVSPNPFAAYYRAGDKHLICASPERYIKKEKQHIISQPIKGTWQRDTSDAAADSINKEKLYLSEKDRAENVMVVDLVRNDLSKVCEEGTVKVDELYGIYSFPQVHQMISTISGTLKQGIHWTEIIKASFPMGSMTGAPKKKVMELIEKYERTKRGVFSGAVGYITPGGDFDFNVVIRSIMYNASKHYLSYQVGSGITFNSDPEDEYEECLLKAAAIEKMLAMRDSL